MILAMALQTPISPTPPASQPLLQWAEYWYPISWQCVLAAGVATALCACVMVAFLVLQWRTASIREMQTAWLAANLEAQTAQASKDTAEALERAADLDREAASLHRRNLSLAELVQPRQLSGEQAHEFTQALAPYSGRSVILWSYGLDLEGSALAEQIRESLIGAHVVVVNNIGQLTLGRAPARRRQIAGADKHLVGALHDNLHAIGGMDAAVAELASAEAAEAVPAEIFVGVKPPPQQKEVAERAAFVDRAALAAVP